MPDEVVFVDEIPHTATGKIQKMELRKQFSDFEFSIRKTMNSSAVSLKGNRRQCGGGAAGQSGCVDAGLHSLQEKLGFIPAEAVPMIALAMNLSRAEVQGVIGFYHDFRTEPGGEHMVQLCRAEACQAMGSRDLELHVKQRLGIDFGETTDDGMFTLEPVYCLGNCACAPSIRINEGTHARISASQFDQLIAGLEAEE